MLQRLWLAVDSLLVESACSPHVRVGSLQVLRLPSTAQRPTGEVDWEAYTARTFEFLLFGIIYTIQQFWISSNFGALLEIIMMNTSGSTCWFCSIHKGG